ncbi:MAG: bifunctional DNA-binding transcriptional regulator/O6-methylguanine-DNA methyltransferase Ada [Pyrinomonadaceae bacterium]|nr:bifunctional DNA-binding transcriptional regulator/O6-methylguanine-DNA methyltransferase Ada [Pyrinomonadaceae bacterium]
MSAMVDQQMNMWKDSQDELWHAVMAKDSRFDGAFVFAVSSTKIYCRPSCPSRRPSRERVSYFRLPEAAEQAGFRACRRCHPKRTTSTDPQIEMVRRACRYIETQDETSVTLADLGEHIGISAFHLQRVFKRIMGITPRQYADACRIGKFKTRVRESGSVTGAMYDAGFSSSSRLYARAPAELGMTPATYGRGGRGAIINYTIAPCSLGLLLVAATERGVCAVKLGDSDAALEADLTREYPSAKIHRADSVLSQPVDKLLNYLSGKQPDLQLPLDIQATAFQWQVWENLRAIPYGETRSYAEVAKAMGRPTAVRAVARACATNPVALVIPCHRVIREDRSLGGYRWGLERKDALLEQEKGRKGYRK